MHIQKYSETSWFELRSPLSLISTPEIFWTRPWTDQMVCPSDDNPGHTSLTRVSHTGIVLNIKTTHVLKLTVQKRRTRNNKYKCSTIQLYMHFGGRNIFCKKKTANGGLAQGWITNRAKWATESLRLTAWQTILSKALYSVPLIHPHTRTDGSELSCTLLASPSGAIWGSLSCP